MKNRRFHLLVIIALVAAVVSVVGFTARGSGNQSRPARGKPPVQTSRSTGATKPKSSSSSAAAAQNAIFRNDLSWTFGGKQQRGWYLYDALLAETLDTDDAPITDDFAAAVTRWQKRRGLGASGMLDENSWMAMVSHWQGNRLKNRASATPDQLITAPATDFYDSSRAEENRQ